MFGSPVLYPLILIIFFYSIWHNISAFVYGKPDDNLGKPWMDIKLIDTLSNIRIKKSSSKSTIWVITTSFPVN
jgi:hypothetical protein